VEPADAPDRATAGRRRQISHGFAYGGVFVYVNIVSLGRKRLTPCPGGTALQEDILVAP